MTTAILPRLIDHPTCTSLEIMHSKSVANLERYVGPFLDLALRLWIARIFFNSGISKILDWESTLFLFEYEYALPILPYEMSAYLGTGFELTMPILLFCGVFTRLAALPLIGMTLVIQFVLGANNPAFDNIEHFYWLIILVVIVLRGAGPISLDYLAKKLFAPSLR